MTMTRTELLTARGYDPEVIAGNGHRTAVSGPPAGPSEAGPDHPAGTGSVPASGALRACAHCGEPLAPGQKRYCSKGCAAYGGGAATRAKVARASELEMPGIEIRNIVTDLPGGPESSGPPAAGIAELLALMDQLPAEVEGVELVNGWRLVRR